MEIDDSRPSTVDPEVRAYVYSLVTALGGSSAELDGRYVLGDDALAVLKDLRRWLKHVDEKLNRFDVARSMAEANLLRGDLLQILASFPENIPEGGLKFKVALACLDLMVTLTWPLDIDDAQMTVGHHRHTPYLQLAQAGYKRAILGHDTTQILRTIVQITIPSMAQPRNERNTRDEDIIRLALYFFRNVVQIAHPADLPMDGEEAEISRSATIDTFADQDIFPFLLTIASSMGSEFVQQDVITLEILFHLLRGINPAKLFMEEQQLAKSNTKDFRDLLQKEKSMLSEYARHAPTRHNRFGAMVWVKRADNRMSTVSGQDVLGNSQRTLNKMDKSKKWNKPKQRSRKTGDDGAEFDVETPLSPSARNHLRSFIEDFLDSSFNPLFVQLRKAIEREADRVLKSHTSQFFYLISWFLKAECARREKKSAKSKGKTVAEEDEGFSLVASVLNQETFILLNRFMQSGVDNKMNIDVNAGMKCFTQILLTIQQMAESSNEDDQDIADNIQNRIFYEESTHDRIIRLVRSYKDQGFGYLDACTELAHVFIRMLEHYSKQNADLQIRSKRRARRKKKEKRKEKQANSGEDGNQEEDPQEDSEEEEEQDALQTTKERKFDFMRFSARFVNENCINTFIAFTKFYHELDAQQLKRAHRFFYRAAFKLEQSVLLFRADIIRLFHRMIEGPNGLDRQHASFKEWKELVKNVLRKLIKKVEERPELIVEILFSKMSPTLYYLQHGYDREVPKSVPRVAPELELTPGLSKEVQIQVAVKAVLLQDKSGNAFWVQSTLEEILEKRKKQEADATRQGVDAIAWASENPDAPVPSREEPKIAPIPLESNDPDRRKAMVKDSKLRLLLSVLGLHWADGSDGTKLGWVFPSEMGWREIEENFHFVSEALGLEEGGMDETLDYSDYIRRKIVPRQRAEFDDDSGEDDFIANDDIEELLFPVGGPTARKPDALEKPKSKRKLKNRGELDDEEKERRARAKRKAESEKQKKIKSALFVHSSDEDSGDDAEFFAQEEKRRENTNQNIRQALLNLTTGSKKRKSAVEGGEKDKRKAKKRKSIAGSDSELSDASPLRTSRSTSPRPTDQILISSDHSSDESDDETPISSQHHVERNTGDVEMSDVDEEPAAVKQTETSALNGNNAQSDSEDDVPVKRAPAPRMRAGFVIDDSDEE
ncbi:timeless-domain-containing protein [Eremomyces bilateralis CBS 781.70]|uniref:Topoisomerase 1-associated factor 1 n=1 Tax=Eremomyces bilateralis CBS 781.70 TaxID=1392243 RepID=A0A6G1G4W1_9PEZI|nr:timeless-domain-containing protein [Eremomyces bilateralis CBS 781.70]KAF1812950.1 timeless-domain-containing protein [Eremomyces bilateralis CBS 781.70]